MAEQARGSQPEKIQTSAGARAWWTYAAGISTGFVLLVAAWVALFIGSFGWFDTFGDRNVFAWYQIKRDAVAARAGAPKVVLAGGSNVLYGLHAEGLSQALGMPCVNYGTHAALPMDYLIHRWKLALKPGDTLVISPEWRYLERSPDDLNETFAGYILGGDPDYFWRLSWRTRAELVFSTGLRRLLLPFLFSKAENDKMQDVYREWILAYYVNRAGDYFWNVPSRSDEKALRELMAGSAAKTIVSSRISNATGDTAYWRAIRGLSEWARKRGVRIFYAAPSLLKLPELSGPKYRKYFTAAGDRYKSLGIPVLTRQADHLYAPEWMFDSVYHLNMKGAELRTRKLADAMGPLLKPSTPGP